MTEKILFVDDDINILNGFKRNLRNKFLVNTATSGENGLKIIRESGPFPVIVSDMRMPGMNGAKFLAGARKLNPDSSRILLTGQADVRDAIAVVNEGNIFRFLTKPCPIQVLLGALKDGVQQYRLINAEKELLEKTLKGSIKLLVDILSIVNPEAFSHSRNVQKLAKKLSLRMKVQNTWKMDVAAMLTQIGCVTIPGEILDKKYQGIALSESEQTMFYTHLEAGRNLIANIPRLENISQIVFYQEKRYDGQGPPDTAIKGKDIPLEARILKVTLDFEELLVSGKPVQQALEEILQRPSWYDPEVLTALYAEIMEPEKKFVIQEIMAKDIKTGMVLAQAIYTKNGVLLIPKDYEISEALQIRIHNFAKAKNIIEPIKIIDWESA